MSCLCPGVSCFRFDMDVSIVWQCGKPKLLTLWSKFENLPSQGPCITLFIKTGQRRLQKLAIRGMPQLPVNFSKYRY